MRTLMVCVNVADPISSKLRGLLHDLVDSKGPATASFADAEEAARRLEAELVVVVLSRHADESLEQVRLLRLSTRGCLMVVGQASDPKLILRALQLGADHYIDEVDLEAEVNAGLRRIRFKQEAAPATGHLLAILGSCGGVGASTLAVNVATVLAKTHGKAVLLDLNPGRGDLAALLDLKPQFSLADLCTNVSRLDRAIFEKMLVRHESGVHLLGAPLMFGDTRVVSAQGVAQALILARNAFPVVVVDLEDCFHEEQGVTLREASKILLVARLDFTSLRNARRILDHLRELRIDPKQVKVVVNRVGQPNELPVAEAESALGVELKHFIEDDSKTINAANNTGIPAVLKDPAAKVSRSITQLAKAVSDRRGQSGSRGQLARIRNL